MALETVGDTAQRIAVVMEHDPDSDDDRWYVVAYLVADNGRRERATLRGRPSRAEAARLLQELWEQMCRR